MDDEQPITNSFNVKIPTTTIDKAMNNYLFSKNDAGFADIDDCYEYAVAKDLNKFMKSIGFIVWLYPLLLPIEVDLEFPYRDDDWREIPSPMLDKVKIKIVDTMPHKDKLMMATILKYLQDNWTPSIPDLNYKHILILSEILHNNKDLIALL